MLDLYMTLLYDGEDLREEDVEGYLAGVREIVACTPCGPDGHVNPVLLYALEIAGATEIYKVGGIQAIGLMAYGGGTIRKVDKIVGPGGTFVTADAGTLSRTAEGWEIQRVEGAVSATHVVLALGPWTGPLLRRLGAEPALAVHPRCGTNLVVTALVSGLASLVALWTTDAQERAARPWTMLPRLLLAGTLSAVVSQPLGPAVQRRFSTRPDVGGTSVGRIVARDGGKHRLHRIELLHGATAGRGEAPGA